VPETAETESVSDKAPATKSTTHTSCGCIPERASVLSSDWALLDLRHAHPSTDGLVGLRDGGRSRGSGASLGSPNLAPEMTPFSYAIDPGEWLYHYTTKEAALGSILPLGLIRMGLFRDTNDPRENKDWVFQLGGHTAVEVRDWEALTAEATRLAKFTTKLLCLTRDDPAFDSDSFTSIFGRGFAHSRMWAQYGGGHTGVCLVFDAERLGQAIEAAFHGQASDLYGGEVEYSDESADDPLAFRLDHDKVARFDLETAVFEHVRRYHRKLFFHKSLDWATEWEYRWVLRGPPPAPTFVPIGGALRGVCLGERFPDLEIESLRYMLGQLEGVSLVRLQWHNGRPRVHHMDRPAGSPPAIMLDNRIRLRPDIVIRLGNVDYGTNRESYELLADDLQALGLNAEVEPEEDEYAHWPAASLGIHLQAFLAVPELLTELEALIKQRITAERFIGGKGAQASAIPIFDQDEKLLTTVELANTPMEEESTNADETESSELRDRHGLEEGAAQE
jgi:hypothetical protein